MRLNLAFHHVCLIASDYQEAKEFYIDLLGFALKRESYSRAKKRRKLELYLHESYLLEVFIYDAPPPATDVTTETGFAHMAFSVESVDKAVQALRGHGVKATDAVLDEQTGKQYAFFYNPDGIKHELYSKV